MIHLLIHFLLRTTESESRGSSSKHVTCEHCGSEYSYVLERVGLGRSTAFIFSRTARRVAEAEAADNLQMLLAADCEPHPCPNCGYYQADMVRVLKKRKQRWMLYLGALLLVGGFIVTSFYGNFSRGHKPLPRGPLYVMEVGGLLIVVTWIMRWCYNPNADAAQRIREK